MQNKINEKPRPSELLSEGDFLSFFSIAFFIRKNKPRFDSPLLRKVLPGYSFGGFYKITLK